MLEKFDYGNRISLLGFMLTVINFVYIKRKYLWNRLLIIEYLVLLPLPWSWLIFVSHWFSCLFVCRSVGSISWTISSVACALYCLAKTKITWHDWL